MGRHRLLIVNLAILLLIVAMCFVIGLVVVRSLGLNPTQAAEEAADEDQTPPAIFDIRIGDITSTSTRIVWQTDEPADSLVSFGLDKRYGMVRDPRADKTEHEIVIDDLAPGSTYFIRMTSSDASGNQGISSDYSFTTVDDREIDLGKGAEGVEGEGKKGEGQTTIQETLEIIKKITDEQTLIVLQAQIEEQADQVVTPLSIILDAAKVEVGTDNAVISWSTDRPADALVAVAAEADYRPNSDDPYRYRIGDPGRYDLDHRVELTGLRPATTYHYLIISKTELGLEAQSRDSTFRTKSIKPEIYNVNLSKVEETAATITFVTNVPCSSIVEYTNLDTNQTKLEGNSSYITVHSVRLTNLLYDTYYSALVTVESEVGEGAEAEPITFITTKDQAPPTIAKVTTEATLYPGSDNKVQTIASWETDEAAKCQFFFHQGLVSIDEGQSLPAEIESSQRHVQVATNFLPSTVYKFWIVCADEVGNSARSQDFTMLTPSQEESIIDIIIKNFESTFGWLKKSKP